MAGLFSTPEEVMAAERAQRAQVARSPNPLAAGFFNLGDAAAGAVARGGFGMDTRSPQQKQATEMQQVMKGIDFKNPDSIAAAAKTLNDMGMQPQAFKLLSMVKEKPWVPEDPWEDTIEVENPDGSKSVKKLLKQKQPDGTTKVIADVTNRGGFPTTGDGKKETSLANVKTNDRFEAPVPSNDDKLWAVTESRILNNPIIKEYMPDTADPEAIKPLMGTTLRVAELLKDRDRKTVKKAFLDRARGLKGEERNIAIMEYQNYLGRPNTDYITQAANLVAQSDTVKDMVKSGQWEMLPINFTKDGTVEAAANEFATLESIEASAAKNSELAFRASRIPDLPGTDDPQMFEGAFNPRHMPVNKRIHGEGATVDAMDIVSELRSGTTPEQLREKLEVTFNKPMSDDTFKEHERFWNVLSSKSPDTQEFIAAYLADTSTQARLALLKNMRTERLDANPPDIAGAIQLRTIKKYLDMFNTDVNVQKGKDDTYDKSLDHLYNDLNLGA